MAAQVQTRSVWPSLLFMGAAVLPSAANAMTVQKKEPPLRVEKVFVTTQFQFIAARDESSASCPTNYSLCAASLSGGCCPNNYGCETNSCVQTTTTGSACSRAGYFNCGIEAGGGCCPAGYKCGVNDCTPPAGVSNSQQCPTGYFLCPASYNYGCCQNGMGCALSACYATTPSTQVFTVTFTTTTDSTGRGAVTTVTSTTVETPTAPSGLPTSDTSNFLPKFLPSTQSKVAEISASSSSSPSSSSGWTQAQIGGLVGGLVALLIVILVVSFLIIRNLRKTAKAFESRRSSSVGGSGQSGSGPSGGPRISRQKMAQVQPTPSQVNQMDYDDLLERETVTTHAHGGTSSASGVDSFRNSGNVRDMSHLAAGALSLHALGRDRTSSENVRASISDMPARTNNRPGRHSTSTGAEARTSMDSQDQQHHASLWQQFRHARLSSSASGHSTATSRVLGSPRQPAELGVDGGLIPELPTAVHGAAAQQQEEPSRRARTFSGVSAVSALSPMSQQFPDTTHSRNRSDSSNSTTGQPSSGQQQQQQQQQQPLPHQTLGVVSEAVEHMHGHYGPTNVAAGQTRAGVEVHFDISSPVVP